MMMTTMTATTTINVRFRCKNKRFIELLISIVLFLAMEERELSIVLSVHSSMYTRLYLTLQKSSDSQYYTTPRQLIKNILINDVDVNTTSSSAAAATHIRTIQDENNYILERKTTVHQQMHKCLYKHEKSQLTLLLNVCDKTSIEDTDVQLNVAQITSYSHILRDYIYCRETGMRISIERHYNDHCDPNPYQMMYDCFNRYKYECRVHIEYEYGRRSNDDDNDTSIIEQFMKKLSTDTVCHQLFTIMANKNLNGISDEIINIQNMNLVHRYGYGNAKHATTIHRMKYLTLKYDGTRHNFCIYGKYLQIGRFTLPFENHWFGQAIIGHCEIMPSGEVILIDIYLITENFTRISKKYNISYTSVLQNYHQFATAAGGGGGGPKTQDEYFHQQRLQNNIEFISPLDAIGYIQLLKDIWITEDKVATGIRLQKFYDNIVSLRKAVKYTDLPIDGCLGFSGDRIYKIKQYSTIDLVFRFDEMFRSIYKRMKANHHELKKIIKYMNIQKSFDWLAFEQKYPGKFTTFAVEFLYFANEKNFWKHFRDWNVDIDVTYFMEQLTINNDCTNFILLLEFKVVLTSKRLIFTRLRTDKFSANAINVFKDILVNFPR